MNPPKIPSYLTSQLDGPYRVPLTSRIQHIDRAVFLALLSVGTGAFTPEMALALRVFNPHTPHPTPHNPKPQKA